MASINERKKTAFPPTSLTRTKWLWVRVPLQSLKSSNPDQMQGKYFRRSLNMSITGDFLDATNKVLLSGKRVLFISTIPSPSYQPPLLCTFKPKESSEGF